MSSCPQNSILYNGSHCACQVGRFLNVSSNRCITYDGSSAIKTDSGIDYYAFSFPKTFISFDSIKKFTQSQAVFLEATLVMLLSWLLFCFFLRFTKLGDGRNVWFKIRWWISRLDVCFATRHWLDDQKLVVKRKTELGGTFSIASWILFTGLFAALLYQIIAKRTIEVHNVRATNEPDLALFRNDMEFNMTTVSSMSCSNLRHPTTLLTGSSGFIQDKVSPISDFLNFSCHNTSLGPTITLKCSNCRLHQDFLSVSWQFVDLPNSPASAVGFQFNVTSQDHIRSDHVSFVSGTMKNGSNSDNSPVTFRGADTNILIFNLFPRLYRSAKDLRLIQPLFHEFVRVGFLADLGGLYCISMMLFFYLLVQCEFRIKRLRNEDSILRNIRSRRKAQEHWDKVRKYVMYTWNCRTLDVDDHSKTEPGCGHFMLPSVHANGSVRGSVSSRKRRQLSNTDLSFRKQVSSEKALKCDISGSAKDTIKHCISSNDGVAVRHQALPVGGDIFPHHRD
ncbi:Single-stranded nucleic acid binding R3H protein, putative isoform 1 [Hibiscus syriacus]|uniref:Single-stranded nucleic acid binding R3H protein, putative isoform 1 n=1 Tax=Hibiscus syriacus TaxID=106335 RepID=A0A6A2ZGI3_HIBSY|nr:Single-stranded nucleic acid binding R3H protein, putative isoform 1 [Hibiscus syriacus]